MYIVFGRNYLVIVFAPDKPLEIWDARSLVLLKELPPQNPIFPAVVSALMYHGVLAVSSSHY